MSLSVYATDQSIEQIITYHCYKVTARRGGNESVDLIYSKNPIYASTDFCPAMPHVA